MEDLEYKDLLKQLIHEVRQLRIAYESKIGCSCVMQRSQGVNAAWTCPVHGYVFREEPND